MNGAARRTAASGLVTSTAAESQIADFPGKYSTGIELQLREARSRLRARFPRGFERVCDNYNALVFAISPSERTSDAFLSVAGYPRWVTLFSINGANLHDPGGLLEGTGKQVRGIRLAHPEDLARSDVEALIVQAVRPHAAALLAAPALTTLVKSVAAKQRARRPAR